MLIQINITIPPGGSAGPFDLYSDADGYAVPFETQVPAASLTAGYIIELPIGATIIRVCSVGACDNCIDIPTNCPTTTTTSTSSTSTTTSTSSSTTTTTTAAPPYRFDWELITDTSADIGTVNLIIEVDSVEQVNSTISPGSPYQSGTLNLVAGQVVTATMNNVKTGTWNFGNKIVQDGGLYQPQDNCYSCVDQLVTPFFSSYTMGSADTSFIFQGDINNPTTSTTSTTTSTSTSTTTTTTTAAPLCDLNGPSAVINTTTTTTTSAQTLTRAFISTSTHPSDACGLSANSIVYVSNIGGFPGNETVTTNTVVYTSSSGTTTFSGNGAFYKILVAESSTYTSQEVFVNGTVGTNISIC